MGQSVESFLLEKLVEGCGEFAQGLPQPHEQEVLESEGVIGLVHQMRGSGAVAQLLQLSASMLEHCAYELARSDAEGQVSRIILISAELERMSQDLTAQ